MRRIGRGIFFLYFLFPSVEQGFVIFLIKLTLKCQCCLPIEDLAAVSAEESAVTQMQVDVHLFTYAQIVKITNNFVRSIGKGGFGIIYHGELEDGTQVAVKLQSQSSPQGDREFLAEVCS